MLVDGTDVTIIATGLMVNEALIAAENLKADGISARVVNMATIKPIDSDIIVDSVKRPVLLLLPKNTILSVASEVP